jgi:hypothetical protein
MTRSHRRHFPKQDTEPIHRGQHGPRRCGRDHVCATILFAQPVVGSTGIEGHRATGRHPLPYEAHLLKIGDDKGDAAIRQGKRPDSRVILCEVHFLQ